MKPLPPNQCAECGGGLERENITHTQTWGDKLYRFENVPVLVCTQCGHVWLEASVSQAIDEIILKHATPKRYEQVPVFSLADELHKA
jgi:YgiT-type zinc finger domain-containing protein